jgi:hypothetical protein
MLAPAGSCTTPTNKPAVAPPHARAARAPSHTASSAVPAHPHPAPRHADTHAPAARSVAHSSRAHARRVVAHSRTHAAQLQPSRNSSTQRPTQPAARSTDNRAVCNPASARSSSAVHARLGAPIPRSKPRPYNSHAAAARAAGIPRRHRPHCCNVVRHRSRKTSRHLQVRAAAHRNSRLCRAGQLTQNRGLGDPARGFAGRTAGTQGSTVPCTALSSASHSHAAPASGRSVCPPHRAQSRSSITHTSTQASSLPHRRQDSVHRPADAPRHPTQNNTVSSPRRHHR